MSELRPLNRHEMAEAAQVFRTAFDERLPWLAGLHTPEEDRGYFEGPVFDECTVWGAFDGGQMVGMVAFRSGWIDQLYVLPGHQGEGVGTSLLEVAKANETELSVWTFQRNEGARRFYERHGFVAVEETDGSGNEEREPDVGYRWTVNH